MFITIILLKMMIIALCAYGLYVWIKVIPKAWKDYKFSDRVFLVILFIFFICAIFVTIVWR